MTSDAVLVTGCSSGIGRATALRLANAGRTVYATARRLDAIAELGRAGCRTLALDVTDEESMRAAVSTIEAEHGAVAALVNNAGYSQSGALETLPMDAIRRQFETNTFGPIRLAQLVLPAMRARRRGRIVNVSTMGGRFTFPGAGAYHASKHALESFSDALRFEVRPFGIDVVVVEPGLIHTGFSGTAVDAIPARADDPYAEFNAGVARTTARGYERGLMIKLGGGPEVVARAIESALTARRPRTRYRVTASASVLIAMRRLLPDRGWDAVIRRSYEPPRP